MRVVCVLLLIFLADVVFSLPSSLSREQHHNKFRKLVAAKSKPLQLLDTNVQKQDGRVLYPIGYGADPTGAQDSSVAILSALEDAFKVQSGLELLPGVNDLGGVVIDLQGGNYKIDQPIRFPASGRANVVVPKSSKASSTKSVGLVIHHL